MTFTIHLPHWLMLAGWFVGGAVIGLVLGWVVLSGMVRSAIGRGLGW